MQPLVLVAAPNEKADGGSGSGWLRSFPSLDAKRHDTIGALQHYLRRSRSHADRLLERTNPFDLDQAININLGLLDAPTMPSLKRYIGGPFPSLADASHQPDLQRTIVDRVVAVSALWGLVRPDDQIPNYLLPINQQLPPIKKLNKWWQPDLNQALEPLTNESVVWDFLPLFYRRAWVGDHSRLISVKMQNAKGQAIRNDGPDARGEVAIHVLANGLTSLDGLETLEHSGGFVFDPERSTSSGLHSTAVFRKDR